MRPFYHPILAGIILSSLLQAGVVRAGEPPLPSHPPPIIVGDVFQFIEGAWAEYEVLDKSDNSTFLLRMAILGQEQARPSMFSRSRTHRWLELDVKIPDEPRAIINLLVEETPDGPGDPNEMILQIEGFSDPIRLGRRWMRGSDEPVLDTEYEWVRQDVGEEVITHGDRSFTAWRVQTEAEDGTTVEAVVSEELPPFGLYYVETNEQRMSLRDWGLGARSTITGQPIGLARWVVRQIRAGAPDE